MNPSPLTRTTLHPRGVTLVELIVTLAIFGAVTTVLLGSFIALFSAREQTNLAQNANDDVRSILDGVEREIQAGNDIVAAGSEIRFTVSSRGDQPPYPVRYRLNGTTIEKAVGKDIAGDPCDYDPASISTWNPGTCWLPVTSPNVSISVLGFSIATSSAADGQSSPLVTVGISGTMRDSNNNTTPLTYSTSITPRNRVTVSDVAPSPASGAPVNALMNMTGAVPPGCRVSNQHYLPIDAPPPPPGGWPDLYTDCTTVNLDFTVNIPGPAGFHSMRYSGPDSAVKFGSGEIGNVPVNFSGGDALTLPLGTSTVTVVAEDLYGQTSNNSFKIQRLMVFTDPPPPPFNFQVPSYGACGSGTMTIRWNAAAFATYYQVSVDGGAWSASQPGTSYVYNGTPGTTHSFRVRAGNAATPPGSETPSTPVSVSYTLTVNCQCSDSADNDSDGFTDFPADPGCTDASDNTEFNTWQCNDGLDNDGDGTRDFGGANPDPGCSSATDNDETNVVAATCAAGWGPEELFWDGWVGSGPFECNNMGLCTSGLGGTTASTNGGVDFCCSKSTSIYAWMRECGGGAPTPVTQCNDGVDNADAEDALIDLADPGCTDASDNDETNAACASYEFTYRYRPCPTCDVDDYTSPGYATLAACVAGWNTRTMFWPPAQPSLGCVCGGGVPVTQCNDGVDNADPEDALIDMADPGCANASDNDEINAVVPTCAAGWDAGELFYDGWTGTADNWCNNTAAGRCAAGPGGQEGGTSPSAKGSITRCCFTNGDHLGWMRTCGASPVTQCNDGVDNADAEDTLIDMADPGCTDPSDTDETNAGPGYPVAGLCGDTVEVTIDCIVAEPVTQTCAVNERAYYQAAPRTISCPMNPYSHTTTYGRCVADATCVAPVPSTPTGLTVTPAACDTQRIDVRWNPAPGATSYQLRDGGTVIYDGPSLSFPHIALAPGSSHTYSVRATNANGSSVYSAAITRAAPGDCAACDPKWYFNQAGIPNTVCPEGSPLFGWWSNGVPGYCEAGYTYTGGTGTCNGSPVHECIPSACVAAPIRAGAYMDTWLCDDFQENDAYLGYGCNIGNNPRGIIFSVGDVESPSSCHSYPSTGRYDRMLFSGGYTYSWSGLVCLEGTTSNTCTVQPNTKMGSRSGSVTIRNSSTGIQTTYPVSATWEQWEVVPTGNPSDCPPIN